MKEGKLSFSNYESITNRGKSIRRALYAIKISLKLLVKSTYELKQVREDFWVNKVKNMRM